MLTTIIEQIKQGQLWDFHGGIHPPENKAISTKEPIKAAGIPSQIILPLKQHIGQKGDILVSAGERVLKGQPLTQGHLAMSIPVHAPTSGQIIAIEERTTAHPSGLDELCAIIEPDGEDTWLEERSFIHDYTSVEPMKLIDHIRQSGIAGLGGAGFPTSRKLQSGIGKAEILIINAAECEPYITADDRLIQDYADEIITGIKILQHILAPKLVIIGIEDNKPKAIQKLNSAVTEQDNIIIRVIPTKYPSGSARQLVKILTGKEVPANGHSSDVGILMQNIGTTFAVKRAVCNGEPLLERVITLTGNSLDHPGNYWVRLGTTVDELMKLAGYKADKKNPRVIMGGSLMGFTLPHLHVPVTKMVNCIIAPNRKELPQHKHEMACIRCSNCADACPVSLLPQQLYWYAKSENYDKCTEYNLDDCIECGACAYVCPSDIPLVQYYRQAKAEIETRKQAAMSAERAKIRFEEKKARMERNKIERENKLKQAAENRQNANKGDNDAIAAAIARVKAQKETNQSAITSPKPAVAAAIARAKAKQAEAHKNSTIEPDNSEMIKLRQERKQQASEAKKTQNDPLSESLVANEKNNSPETNMTSKSQAITAAVAKAKARKDSQKTDNTTKENSIASNTKPHSSHNEKKAAVSAAKAKERKKQQADSNNDPKKAAVAAAIARAKARKAEQQKQNNKEE